MSLGCFGGQADLLSGSSLGATLNPLGTNPAGIGMSFPLTSWLTINERFMSVF